MSATHNPHTDPIAAAEDEALLRPRSPAVIQMEKDALEEQVRESEALHIYQDFIDSMSECNMSRDLDAWCDLHSVPYMVHLDDLDSIIKSHDETRQFLEMLTELSEEHGIDQITRIGDSAKRIGHDQIEGYHTCYLLSNGDEVLEPVDSRLRIQKMRGRWRIVGVTNNLSNQKYPYARPQVSDGLQTSHAIESRMKGSHSPKSSEATQDNGAISKDRMTIKNLMISSSTDRLETGDKL
ncbi:hypothetical protein [Planktotalea sp.]|uniref:hypothetical protein n=1 Tax=Planktotalea sp. TaxID=2029877 RepID=UPI0035C869BA